MTRETGGQPEDWTEPGTYEVTHGVYRIPLPLPNDGLKAVNVYAILGEDSLTLVDSGWALDVARNALEKALKVLGCGLGDVQRFLVTHAHRDHYTQAVALRQIFGSPISLGEGERPTLAALVSPEFEGLTERIAQLQTHGAGDVVSRLISLDSDQTPRAEWEMPDVWLQDQEEIELSSRTLRVVNTPGHTRGHVVFVDEGNGLLFAGDHVLPHITPSIGFEPGLVTSPLGSYLASLRLVRSMPDRLLLPAHGPVSPSVHRRVDEILSHHGARLSAALSAVGCGATTAYEVARLLPWTGRGRPFDTLDPFNQMLAVLETATHLVLLVAQNQLTVRTADGVHHFEVVASPEA
jgi:glyoxylase-like metal-dependent hydrolase (beta-lactamase superfamily II)